MTELLFENLHYIYEPAKTDEERAPAILFLHGAGGLGPDITRIRENPFFVLSDLSRFHAYAPHCYGSSWFDIFEQLQRFAQWITEQPCVDAERVYLMGGSMGGYGAWQLAMTRPDLFAALVPICGGGMYWAAGRLKTVPVWAFHGALDTTVLPEESRKMVDSVNRHGGKARLTIYPEAGHDAWSPTYRNPEVFDWLLAQKKHKG